MMVRIPAMFVVGAWKDAVAQGWAGRQPLCLGELWMCNRLRLEDVSMKRALKVKLRRRLFLCVWVLKG